MDYWFGRAAFFGHAMAMSIWASSLSRVPTSSMRRSTAAASFTSLTANALPHASRIARTPARIARQAGRARGLALEPPHCARGL